MIFSDSPSQKALERMMTQVKGFPPRGSGVMVLRRFEYTAEMCDCRLCLYYNRKKKCTVSQCPCIEERIVAGAAGRSEVMTETMKDIHNAAFRKRLIQFIRESEELHMNFRNEKHRLAFDEAIRKLNKKNFALMSALYLLTAEHKLGLFDFSHCSEDADYAGKLLILKPSILKDDYKASDYQLFYAESGFGCSPSASGRKVFGKFLKDGENTNFNRSDFLGVIKDECIPEWVAEKLAELEPPDEDESEGITMGGI